MEDISPRRANLANILQISIINLEEKSMSILTSFSKLFVDAPKEGGYGFVKLDPVLDALPRNLVPFNAVMTESHPEDKWFHFYVDDYRFNRIWNNPEKYIPILKRFEGGITPDFSMLVPMKEVEAIENCRKNRLLAYLFQKIGIPCVINVGWGYINTYTWAFDGIPCNSILCITTQGCMKNRVCKHSLVNGLHELVRKKHPTKLFVYGLFPEEWKMRFSMPIEVMPSFSQLRFEGGKYGKR